MLHLVPVPSFIRLPSSKWCVASVPASLIRVPYDWREDPSQQTPSFIMHKNTHGQDNNIFPILCFIFNIFRGIWHSYQNSSFLFAFMVKWLRRGWTWTCASVGWCDHWLLKLIKNFVKLGANGLHHQQQQRCDRWALQCTLGHSKYLGGAPMAAFHTHNIFLWHHTCKIEFFKVELLHIIYNNQYISLLNFKSSLMSSMFPSVQWPLSWHYTEQLHLGN